VARISVVSNFQTSIVSIGYKGEGGEHPVEEKDRRMPEKKLIQGILIVKKEEVVLHLLPWSGTAFHGKSGSALLR
jgi:hypothetical protein